MAEFFFRIEFIIIFLIFVNLFHSKNFWKLISFNTQIIQRFQLLYNAFYVLANALNY